MGLGACGGLAPRAELRPSEQTESLRVFEEAVGILETGALAERVTAVGMRIGAPAAAEGLELRFRVTDDPLPNAHAFAGGRIYVSRGLLLLLGGEDELALALAHEIAHLALDHPEERRRLRREIEWMAFPLLFAAHWLGEDFGQIFSAPARWTGRAVLAGDGRQQELAADRQAQRWAFETGFRPSALVRCFEALERDARRRGEPSAPQDFWSSHPAAAPRIAEAQRHAAELGDPAGVEERSLRDALDGLVVGDDPAAGLLRGGEFLQPELGFALALPRGWSVQHNRRWLTAFSPERDLQLQFEYPAESADLRETASLFLDVARREFGLRVARLEAQRIQGRSALRAQALLHADGRAQAFDLGWIAFGERVFLLAGSGRGRYGSAQRDLFDRALAGLRELRPEERTSLQRLRLRYAPARAGERLAEFAARHASAWDAAALAALNGIDLSTPLGEGQLLGIVVAEPYAAEPPQRAAPASHEPAPDPGAG